MPLLPALFLAVPLSAVPPVIDDSDISGGRKVAPSSLNQLQKEGRQEGRVAIFPALASPSFPRIPAAENKVSGILRLADGAGVWHPAALARIQLAGPNAPKSWVETDGSGRFIVAAGGLEGTYRARFSLDNQFWIFHNPANRTSYEWETPPFTLTSGGIDLGNISPIPGSENAKAGMIHLTYSAAARFLQTEGDVAWWNQPLTVNWPGTADFFSPWAWSLDVTNPIAWDVNLHELGHAVMAGAMNAEPASGQHKIDECYSQELAWSEGWASFLAAAVGLARDDADAKFEFLVPRRAPIRVENVPADVCRGISNEWRVTAGLWDLFDTNADGRDQFAMPFALIWKALREKQTDGFLSGWALIAQQLNPDQRRAAQEGLTQNTLLPERSALPEALPVTLLSAPNNWAQR